MIINQAPPSGGGGGEIVVPTNARLIGMSDEDYRSFFNIPVYAQVGDTVTIEWPQGVDGSANVDVRYLQYSSSNAVTVKTLVSKVTLTNDPYGIGIENLSVSFTMPMYAVQVHIYNFERYGTGGSNGGDN